MTVEQFIAFNAALLAAIASPGPALLIAVRTTLVNGRVAGILTGFGLASMAALWTLMALLSLHVLFDLFPWAYFTAKTLGAAYLLLIAYRTWNRAGEEANARPLAATHAFRLGFLINLFNPKSVLFAAAVLIVIFPAEMSAIDNTLVVLNHLIVELLFYTILAYGMTSSAVRNRYLGGKLYIDRTAAIVLGALGLRLFLNL